MQFCQIFDGLDWNVENCQQGKSNRQQAFPKSLLQFLKRTKSQIDTKIDKKKTKTINFQGFYTIFVRHRSLEC